MARRTRVLWATNFASPYRIPVWTELGKHVELTLLLTGRPGQAQTTSRPPDWLDPPHGMAIARVRVLSRTLAGHDLVLSAGGLADAVRQADVVMLGGWETPVYWQLLRLARRFGKRTVGFYEASYNSHRFVSGPIAWARRLFFRSLDAVVSPGEATTRELLTMDVADSRISTGFNAVDVRRFHDASEQSNRCFDPAAGHRFVYVGQLIPRKNLLNLVKAFAAMPRSDTLDIVGEGVQREELEAAVKTSGLDDRVRLLGALPHAELPQFLALRHTLVLPSTNEVWGLVVNEALAAGLQAVVSRAAGVTPSVRRMAGVHVVDTTEAGILEGLRRAHETWSGWIHHPEILQHTPAAFAETFRSALAPHRAEVVIVQSYVPRYRKAFFEQLAQRLREKDIDLVIAVAKPSRSQTMRGDATHIDTQIDASGLRVSFGIAGAELSSYGAWSQIKKADAVVVPAAATLVDAHLALFGPGRRNRKVALWGHIDSFVKPGRKVDLGIEKYMMKCADHVFAYTDRGGRFAVSQGVPESKVTVTNNTIDTNGIRAAQATVTQEDVTEFRQVHGIVADRVFGYIGGLDAAKGVDFLAQVLRRWRETGANAQILIAGRGEGEILLHDAVAHGQAILLGYGDERIKALIAGSAEALIAPGRIGLVAVDALALDIPIAARPFKFHGPEADYLTEGSSIITGPARSSSFADWLLNRRFEPPHEEAPRLNDMVTHYVDGLLAMLAAPGLHE